MDRSSRLRRAALSKAPLITLAIVAIVAAGFWVFQLSSSGPGNPKAASRAERDAQQWMMSCDACGYAFPMSFGEIRTAKLNEKGRLECPKCKKFAVASTRMSPEDYAEANKKP
jgi:hypothetical protein